MNDESIFIVIWHCWNTFISAPYDGRYDNMLWYFVYMHRLVADAHKRRGTKREGRVCKDDGGPEGKRKVLNRGIPERMLNTYDDQ